MTRCGRDASLFPSQIALAFASQYIFPVRIIFLPFRTGYSASSHPSIAFSYDDGQLLSRYSTLSVQSLSHLASSTNGVKHSTLHSLLGSSWFHGFINLPTLFDASEWIAPNARIPAMMPSLLIPHLDLRVKNTSNDPNFQQNKPSM